jgi:hypothetical protein
MHDTETINDAKLDKSSKMGQLQRHIISKTTIMQKRERLKRNLYVKAPRREITANVEPLLEDLERC